MSYADLLINSCTTQRFNATATDAYGNPTGSWDTALTESCRLVADIGRELKIGAEVVIANYKLFLGDVDITEQDRVVVSGTTYEVLLVSDRQDSTGSHHKECYLRTVR